VIDAVKRRMESLATSLVRAGAASSFQISEDDGLQLRVRRAADGVTASATMTGTTEVYLLDLGGVYTTVQTAYDDDDKWKVLDDFLESVRVFIEGDYYEEIGERNGHVVSRAIYLNVPGGPRPVSASLGLRAAIGRLLGYKKSVVRPAGR
jgi:hypothetical protein